MVWRISGHITWLIFGGFETAFGCVMASVFLACTIVGIPFAGQTMKLALSRLRPFGSTIIDAEPSSGCPTLPLKIVRILFGGLRTYLFRLFFGALLYITIIGNTRDKQRFKVAGLALMPFGKDVILN